MCISESAGLKSFGSVFSLAPLLLCEHLCVEAGGSLGTLCVCVTLAPDSAVVSQHSGG